MGRDTDELSSLLADPLALLESIGARSAAQSRAENFPVALRLLPRRPRDSLQRVYSFARFVDDVGDEAPGDRTALLDVIDADVRALTAGVPVLGPVVALRPLVEECGVPLQPLLDLVEANRVDQHTVRYETYEDLLGYCRLSASPVGRIVLHVAGAATDRNVADSDAVCSALQVLEHCQDVGEDATNGRVYLPAAELRAAGVTESELHASTTSSRLRQVIAVQVERARQGLQPGHDLVRRLSGWSRLAVTGYIAGGLATADALRRADHDVLSTPVRPTHARTALSAIGLLVAR
jgi:squalene synthase HpnC